MLHHQISDWTSEHPTHASTTYFSEHEPDQQYVTKDNQIRQVQSLPTDLKVTTYQSQRNSQIDSNRVSHPGSATTIHILPFSTLLEPPTPLSRHSWCGFPKEQNPSHWYLQPGTRFVLSFLLPVMQNEGISQCTGFLSPSSISLSWILSFSI